MKDNELLSAYRFYVEIDGIETARFQKCEGLEAETEVIEIEEGGGGVHHFRGRTRHPNIILEKGINDNDEIFKWYKQTFLDGGKIEKKNGAIVFRDAQGAEIKRWNFFRALPCRWGGPNLNARDRSTFAVERIEIAHEGLEVDNDSASFDFQIGADMSGTQNFTSEMNGAVFYDDSGNPSSDPYVITGRNIGEAVLDEPTVPPDAADNLIAAQDAAMNNPIYREGGGGPFGNFTGSDTWCKQATFEIARDAAPGLADAMYGTDPNGYNTNANMAAANLATAAASADSPITEITPQMAQDLANQGYTVVAAWENPTGNSGHLATVRPGRTFNETEGPMLNNIGDDARTGIETTSASFIRGGYANGDVHFYYDSEQFD